MRIDSYPVYLCDIPSIPAEKVFCSQAQTALQRIRGEIENMKARSMITSPPTRPGIHTQLPSPKGGLSQPPRPLLLPEHPPRKDFYENTKELFESLLRKGDLRDIQQLQGYLRVQAQIRDLMNQHAPVEQIRPLQKSIPNPIEIMKIYTSRDPVPDTLNEVSVKGEFHLQIKKRLSACDVSMVEYTKRLIPEDPVIFVEMNDLDTYLKLIDHLSFCTDVVELASVKENALFVQHWMKLLMECRKILEECKQWIDGVEEDIRQSVLRDSRVLTWMQSMFVEGL